MRGCARIRDDQRGPADEKLCPKLRQFYTLGSFFLAAAVLALAPILQPLL